MHDLWPVVGEAGWIEVICGSMFSGKTEELIRRLNDKIGSHSCKELTGVDFTDLNAALAFHASKAHEKCFTRVADGAEEIALFIKELDQKGELFRSNNFILE